MAVRSVDAGNGGPSEPTPRWRLYLLSGPSSFAPRRVFSGKHWSRSSSIRSTPIDSEKEGSLWIRRIAFSRTVLQSAIRGPGMGLDARKRALGRCQVFILGPFRRWNFLDPTLITQEKQIYMDVDVG